MKTLIIYESICHGNTERVARKMAEVLGAVLKKPNEMSEVPADELMNYDLIGFGSGVKNGKFHASISRLIRELPDMGGKKAFVFCTSFLSMKKYVNNVAEELKSKNLEVAGIFSCPGYSDSSIIKFLFKDRPNKKDLAAAGKFAEGLSANNR